MKNLVFLISLLVGHTAFSNEVFWNDISEGNSSKWNNQKFSLLGEVQKIERKVRSRDNYYLIEIKDPNSEKFVEVKFYTIVKLHRINKIDCKVGDKMTLSGKFQHKHKSNQIGKMIIKEKDETLVCHKKQPQK